MVVVSLIDMDMDERLSNWMYCKDNQPQSYESDNKVKQLTFMSKENGYAEKEW